MVPPDALPDAPLEPSGTPWGAASVGLRVMATNGDDARDCFPGTIVMYRPAARACYQFLIHLDDGDRALVGLPDPGVRVLHHRVTHCTCARCTLASPEGELLGPAGRAFDLPRR